jgi:hypothetical protein
MRSKTTKQSVAPTKPFSLPRENTLKRMPGINTPDQTTGFDHVGHHYQPDLPPVVQEIPGRRAEAEGAGSALGLGSEANGYLALITGRPQHPPQHADHISRLRSKHLKHPAWGV